MPAFDGADFSCGLRKLPGKTFIFSWFQRCASYAKNGPEDQRKRRCCFVVRFRVIFEGDIAQADESWCHMVPPLPSLQCTSEALNSTQLLFDGSLRMTSYTYYKK